VNASSLRDRTPAAPSQLPRSERSQGYSSVSGCSSSAKTRVGKAVMVSLVSIYEGVARLQALSSPVCQSNRGRRDAYIRRALLRSWRHMAGLDPHRGSQSVCRGTISSAYAQLSAPTGRCYSVPISAGRCEMGVRCGLADSYRTPRSSPPSLLCNRILFPCSGLAQATTTPFLDVSLICDKLHMCHSSCTRRLL
jgi:hypothetical protein